MPVTLFLFLVAGIRTLYSAAVFVISPSERAVAAYPPFHSPINKKPSPTAFFRKPSRYSYDI